MLPWDARIDADHDGYVTLQELEAFIFLSVSSEDLTFLRKPKKKRREGGKCEEGGFEVALKCLGFGGGFWHQLKGVHLLFVNHRLHGSLFRL